MSLSGKPSPTQGQGRFIYLDPDVAGAMPGGGENLVQTLSAMASEEGRRKLESRHARQTNHSRFSFGLRNGWQPARRNPHPGDPYGLDGHGRSRVLGWASSHRLAARRLAERCPVRRHDRYASPSGTGRRHPRAVSRRSRLLRPLDGDAQAPSRRTLPARDTDDYSNDDGEKITAHFVVEIEPSPTTWSVLNTRVKAAKNRFHEEAMVRIDLMRRLFPDREPYASQGYGHHLWPSDLDVDDTRKTGIARKQLPPPWLTSVNAMFQGLAEREFRPHSWPSMSSACSTYVMCSGGLETAGRWHRAIFSAPAVRPYKGHHRCRRWMGEVCRTSQVSPLLPSCVLDEWGVVDEHTSEPIDMDMRDRAPRVSQHGLALQAYEPFLNTFRSYTSALWTFFASPFKSWQSIHGLAGTRMMGRRGRAYSNTRSRWVFGPTAPPCPHIIWPKQRRHCRNSSRSFAGFLAYRDRY